MNLRFNEETRYKQKLRRPPEAGLAALLVRRFPRLFTSKSQANVVLLCFVFLTLSIAVYLFSQSGVPEVENPLLDPETGAVLPQEI